MSSYDGQDEKFDVKKAYELLRLAVEALDRADCPGLASRVGMCRADVGQLLDEE